MQVGDIVWFDPSKPNVWGAFCNVDLTEPFKVKIVSVMHDGALGVTPIPCGGAPEVLYRTHQLVQESQLSEDYPNNSGADEPTVDILWLIEQLEWLSVEQKKISKKELLALLRRTLMSERKKITLELSKEEAQFLHDFLGNIVIGNPTMTSRRHSDSVIYKLEDKGIHYEEEDQFYLKVKEVMYIEFIA